MHNAHNVIHQVLPCGGRGKHTQSAHILAAKALRCYCQPYPIPGHQAGVDHGRRIVAGIYPVKERVAHDALAQQAVRIAGRYAGVHRRLKVAINVHILPNFCKHNGHTGVLTNGQIQFFGCCQIVL